MGQVGLADCSGRHPVGHVLVPVMAAGDPVDVQDNGLVNLEASNGPALVTDGQVVVAALDHYQGRDEIGDSGHGLESCARWPVAPLGVV